MTPQMQAAFEAIAELAAEYRPGDDPQLIFDLILMTTGQQLAMMRQSAFYARSGPLPIVNGPGKDLRVFDG